MRVLFLAYEMEACAMALLAREFEKDKHEVLLAQCDYYDFNDVWEIHDFFEENEFDSWVDSASNHEQLIEKKWQVDWEYLQRFEERYCVTKNIQQLLMTDPIIARHHHFRKPYYTPIKSRDRQYYWLEQILKWSEKVFETFKPDRAVTFGRNYLIKNVFDQFSRSTDLNMSTVIRSRVGDRYHVVDNFGYGTSDKVERFINKKSTTLSIDEASNKVDEYRQDSSGGLYNATAQQRLQNKHVYPFSEIARYVCNKTKGFVSSVIKRTKSLRFWKQNSFYGQSLLAYIFFMTIALRRLRYRIVNEFDRAIPKRPFIYLPLHTLPESSTLTLTEEYYENDIIRFIAKEVPANYVVVTKENPNMIGIRTSDFYEDISSIPNVKLLDPKVPSKKLIRRSEGVTGISGTALLEAAVLGRPTHCFGHPEFEEILDNQGYNEFSNFVKLCQDNQNNKVRNKVLKYVQFILNKGIEVPLSGIRQGDRQALSTENIKYLKHILVGK